MHHIYTTKSIIIKSVSVGEANKIYFLLTEDLGFIKATAQGVRLGKSKLKGHLCDFSISNISVVKGRNTWRITNAETLSQGKFIGNINKLFVLKNIFSLLLRLLHGEEKNTELFLTVESFYNFILINEFNTDELKDIEIVVVLRILYYLGYFKNNEQFSVFLKDTALSFELLNEMKNFRKMAIKEINNSLKETHL